MIELFDLTGKTAILTGGAGGIGRALALGMARCGADILVADLDPDNFRETAVAIRALGRQVTVLRVEVTEEQSVSDMVDSALEEFQHIDILVNAAGIAIRKPAESFPINEWQKVMDINVRGTFLSCQAVGKVMIEQGGGKGERHRARYGRNRSCASHAGEARGCREAQSTHTRWTLGHAGGYRRPRRFSIIKGFGFYIRSDYLYRWRDDSRDITLYFLYELTLSLRYLCACCIAAASAHIWHLPFPERFRSPHR